MNKQQLKKLIDVAAKRIEADLVIQNVNVVDVYNGTVIENTNIAISDQWIAGVGDYQGQLSIDGAGQFAAPGFIDGHIHIESSYVTPEEIGRLLVPHGATTIIADPHEIGNVSGMMGIEYMIKAAEQTKLDIRYVLPSCVPATGFENSGAILDSEIIRREIGKDTILGLGEFMNYPGVVNGDDEVIEKLLAAIEIGKVIDGHCVNLTGELLNAYVAPRIGTDHECNDRREALDRTSRGMYVLLREGSACHNLRENLKAVTPMNCRRFLLCSDDRQPETIMAKGHLDHHLRICVEEGVDPIMGIQMATINAAECYGLKDRGAIAPGLLANIVLFDNLKDFNVNQVYIKGEAVARQGQYLPEVHRYPIGDLETSFHVKDFSIEKLKMKLKSNQVNVIELVEGGITTRKVVETIVMDEFGEFIYDSDDDIVKVAVIERHKETGNVAKGFIKGYGIKHGAVALSIAHDSHNIICVGTNDQDMTFAVEQLIRQKGGIILVKDGKIVNQMPMVVGGIMSDESGEWVSKRLGSIHKDAMKVLGIDNRFDPVMTLCFMSLLVIPEIKISDCGLFDVNQFQFISVEA